MVELSDRVMRCDKAWVQDQEGSQSQVLNLDQIGCFREPGRIRGLNCISRLSSHILTERRTAQGLLNLLTHLKLATASSVPAHRPPLARQLFP